MIKDVFCQKGEKRGCSYTKIPESIPSSSGFFESQLDLEGKYGLDNVDIKESYML